MYHLRLIKALSYSGVVSATRKHPDVYTKDKAIADAAVATGYFAIVAELEATPSGPTIKPPADAELPEPDGTEGIIPDYEELSRQTKAELTAYAQARGISIDGCKTKADILEAISAACGGSYTMMELQKEV